MNIYIGIDVAKTFHVACATDSQGEVLTQLRFENDSVGFQGLRKTIKGPCPQETGQLLWGMESTGHYGVALRDFLTRLGYSV